jgi:hypothetical protein
LLLVVEVVVEVRVIELGVVFRDRLGLLVELKRGLEKVASSKLEAAKGCIKVIRGAVSCCESGARLAVLKITKCLVKRRGSERLGLILLVTCSYVFDGSWSAKC